MSFRRTVKRVVSRLLPSQLKGLLFRGAFSLMSERQRGHFMAAYQMASVEWSLRNARALGFTPKSIVDVGAYVGDWTRMVKGVFPDSSVLMVEAQPGKEPRLRDTATELEGVSYHICLLGPEPKDSVPFYELETGSGVLPEQSRIGREVVSYPMTTLDNLLESEGRGGADFVKLDVQGYELEILKGASGALQSAEMVLMEVSLIPVNEGAPLLHDVVTFMHSRGFRAYDICSFIRRPLDRALWQTDMLFVSERSPLIRSSAFH